MCVAEGRPPPSVTWFQESTEVEQSEGVVSVVTVQRGERQSVSNLTIESALPRDATNYTCNATNIAGSDTSSATLTVHGMSTTHVTHHHWDIHSAVMPEILSLEPSPLLTVNQSDSAVFECNATGIPPPIISWSMSTREQSVSGSGSGDSLSPDDLLSPILITESDERGYLTPGGYVVSVSSVLTISPTVSNDSGTYTCTASNTVGTSMTLAEDEQNTTLYIQGQCINSILVSLR